MPIKTPTLKPAKKMVVHTVSTPLPYAHYQRCTQCDMLFRLPVLKRNQSAWCPRCNAKVRDGRDWSLTRLGSMALAMLLLMPFAWSEPLLRLHLLGVRIDANVLQGIWQMTAQGDPITAAMVLFCAVVAPVLLVVSISYLWLGNVLGMNLRPVLLMLGKLKEWVMLDIYLVGIGVASIKVQDYAFLQPGIGLVAFISLTLLSILTLIHMNVEELWERFYPERPATRADNNLQVCTGCHYTGYRDARPLPTLPHAAASSPTAEPAAQLGGADCLAGFPLSGQPVANLHYLRQRRAPGRHDPLGDHLPGQQQYRHCRGRVYRQYFGAIHQSYSVIYPAAQHTIQVRAGIAHPHPAAAANHLDWPLVDAGSVCYLTHHVANKSRSAPRLHHGAGCGLLWRRGNFNYSCS